MPRHKTAGTHVIENATGEEVVVITVVTLPFQYHAAKQPSRRGVCPSQNWEANAANVWTNMIVLALNMIAGVIPALKQQPPCGGLTAIRTVTALAAKFARMESVGVRIAVILLIT